MPIGLIIIDASLVFMGVILSIIFHTTFSLYPILVFNVIACAFNLGITIAQWQGKLDGHFGYWIFGD